MNSIKKQSNLLLNADNLQSVTGLKLLAKQLVNSQLQGNHRSHHQLSSREFNQYKAYQPGDDTRLIDWKVYSRTDRYFIRETYTDRQVNVHFILDASASMEHQNSEQTNKEIYSKLDIARLIFATLGYLANEQGNDSLKFTTLGAQQTTNLSNKSYNNLEVFLHALTQTQSGKNWPQTPTINVDNKQSNLFVFLSDFYEKNEEMTKFIQALAQRKNEILVFMLLFENELELTYPSNAIFKDLETQTEIKVNTKDFQLEYKKRIKQKIENHKKQLIGQNIDFQLITNALEIGPQLRLFLKKRQNLT